MLDDRDSSYEISPLNRIKDEYPFFIIEIAGEPKYCTSFSKALLNQDAPAKILRASFD